MPQNSRESNTARDQVQRDNQQIQDDNQTSGESVVAGQTSGDNQQPVRDVNVPDQAANKDPAEGSRETVSGGGRGDVGGVSNRPLSGERDRQPGVPRRGEAKGDSHA
jgi:hypothetical protein